MGPGPREIPDGALNLNVYTLNVTTVVKFTSIIWKQLVNSLLTVQIIIVVFDLYCGKDEQEKYIEYGVTHDLVLRLLDNYLDKMLSWIIIIHTQSCYMQYMAGWLRRLTTI